MRFIAIKVRSVAAIRAVVLTALLSSALQGPARAQDVPWRNSNFELQASNEPLNAFLLRLFVLEGVSATMSPTVASARVNGRFKGTAAAVFKEAASTYGLTSYFDGSTLHVYSLLEMETRLLQVDPIDVSRIERLLRQMKLFDARFPLRVSSAEGQVLVSGPPRYADLVEQVVSRVAASPSRPKAGVEVRVFKLKYAHAQDTVVAIGGIETRVAGVASTLNSLLNDARMEPESVHKQLPRTMGGLRGQGLAAVGQPASRQMPMSPAGGAADATGTVLNGLLGQAQGATQPGGASAAALAASMATPAGGVAQEVSFVRGNAVIRADARLNAVVVRDTRERMPMYAQVISSLDIETPLVEIEATVIDVADDKSEQLGIDWRLHSKRIDFTSSPNDLAGNGSGTGRNLANDLLFSADPLSAGRGLVGTLLFGNERRFFLSRLNALSERGDANLVSRPKILTIDNHEAVLQSTKEFYVRVAGREQVDLFNVSLGMVMRVTPTLVEDEQGRRFKLQVRIEDGNTNSGQQVDQIPVVNRNAIATQAIVGDGQSLLIGGYINEERSNSNSSVPGLSSIPVLGWLFAQRGNTVRRNERMFMITPRLVDVRAPSENPPLAPSKPSLPAGETTP
jgi:type III secretion protein C